MNTNILTTDDLKIATGYDRQADIEKHLRENNIRYFRSRRGVWTTISLVNAAGGILPGQPQENQELL